MKITVSMTSEEFVQFLDFQKDKEINIKRAEEAEERLKLFNKKLSWAIEPNPKKEGTYKIVDQDHLDDLWLLAGCIE